MAWLSAVLNSPPVSRVFENEESVPKLGLTRPRALCLMRPSAFRHVGETLRTRLQRPSASKSNDCGITTSRCGLIPPSHCQKVVRQSIGWKTGGAAQHAQSTESWWAHTPGLVVVCPATARDNRGLLKAAIRDNDPVIFFEHKALYDTEGEVPEDDYAIPLGEADIKREGKDATIASANTPR